MQVSFKIVLQKTPQSPKTN